MVICRTPRVEWIGSQPSEAPDGLQVTRLPNGRLRLRSAAGALPLYYTHTDDAGVLVATHLPSLADHPSVDDTIDPEGVALRYRGSNFGTTAGSRTDFVAINVTPFGRELEVTNDGLCRLVSSWVAAAPSRVTPQVAAEQLRTAVSGSIADTIGTIGEGRVAMSVSGHDWLAALLHERLVQARGRGLDLGYTTTATDVARDYPVLRVPLPTRQTREWTSSLDYHRYSTRSRDSNVRLVLALAQQEITDLVLYTDIVRPWLDHLVASLLRRGRWAQARRVAEVTGRRDVVLQQGMRSALVAWTPQFVKDLRTEWKRPRGPRPRGTKSNGDPLLQGFPAVHAASAARAESLRGIRNASSAIEHELRGNEHLRSLSGLAALAGSFGIRVHVPLRDPALLTVLTSLPDEAWLHDGIGNWVIGKACEPWTGDSVAEAPSRRPWTMRRANSAASVDLRRKAAVDLKAAEEGLPRHSWRENDPRIAPYLGSRPVETGPLVDPRDWDLTALDLSPEIVAPGTSV